MTKHLTPAQKRRIERPHAVFAVVRCAHTGKIWATTREGGGLGLPGGKRDPGETPLYAVRREAVEEGLHLHGKGTFLHRATVDGKSVEWWLFDEATPLPKWKEQHRGIAPVLVPLRNIAESGFGNEFLLDFNGPYWAGGMK